MTRARSRHETAADVLLLASPAAPELPRSRAADFTLDAGAKGGAVSDALRIVMLLTLLAVLPAIMIAMTSFTRTIIVLSMLRHAFGMQDTPPNMVLVSLALFLTLFTMAPAFQASYQNGIQPLADNQITMESAVDAGGAAAARVHDPADPREGPGADPGDRARSKCPIRSRRFDRSTSSRRSSQRAQDGIHRSAS